MTQLPRTPIIALVLAAALSVLPYASLGTAKTLAQWNWMDIIGEGGTALMSALWAVLILGSRPRGRVTALLAGGLSAIMLGAWVDCLDEFFTIPHDQYWDNALESLLTPGGMAILTAGLYLWRQEQFSLNEHMLKRERLFREHRAFDRVTQLADAAYLRRQLQAERRRCPDAPLSLVLLDLDHFHRINREHGQAEGDRLLQAISHLLLLNLRRDDLLCRYAGDRFAILLPETDEHHARRMAAQLTAIIAQLAYHTADGQALSLSARSACSRIHDDDAEHQLSALNRALEAGAISASA